MNARSILAIDQGTSATKALVVREDGSIAGSAEVPVKTRYLDHGGVEADPGELWDSVCVAGRRAVSEAGGAVAAVALANQGETVLAWDRSTGDPRSAAIVWQDRRAESVCDRLAPHAERVQHISGLRLDSYFAAPKMTWLRDQGCREGVVTTSDAWLLSRLTGAFATDAATASRTGLLDLDTASWSPELAELFGIEPEGLPEVVGNSDVVGTTTEFGGEIPVLGTAVDQQAALFAEGCHRRGQAKCTYGTGAFLLANTGKTPQRSSSGVVSCVAWRLGTETTYCLDGQVYTVGSVVDWLQGLGVIDRPADIDRYAERVAGAEAFVPALAGLAAPYWAPHARGAFVGLSLSSDRRALVSAVVEGLAANIVSLAQAVGDDLGEPLSVLKADGGLTRSRALMQAQADLLQRPVEVFATPHATALGVAGMARLGLGWADSPETAVAFDGAGPTTIFEPGCGPDEAAERIGRWTRAADAVLELASP
ncbi:MAG TPA: FGGY family carbohydrate kinase [Nocardioidaceae bacterium]|nr:FGGY family carbohydrate kinase [Nocardioidaceae bacterium]